MKHPLQTYREHRDLTQQGMAELLGCSQSLVALIETGKRSVSRANAEKWEKKTGIPIVQLMFPEHGDSPAAVISPTSPPAP